MDFLKRPLLLEGDAAVSNTAIGKGLAAIHGSELIRLQCYEGLAAKQRLQTSALTSSAGDVIRHRRRLFFPRVLVDTLSTARVMASTPVSMVGFEQGPVVARQFRAVALAGGIDALRFVDDHNSGHRRQSARPSSLGR
jgi:hypothetical protein